MRFGTGCNQAEPSVEGFCGVNNSGDPLTLKFKPDCMNSVFANNGVGNTSLFEALQFVIHGEGIHWMVGADSEPQ